MTFKPKHLNIILLLAFAILMPFLASAAVLEVGIPGQEGAEAGTQLPTLTQYMRYVYFFMLGIVGIAAFVSLVWYGVMWIYSGIVEKKSEALEGIKNTFIGIALAFGAYIILNTINPDIVSFREPEKLKPAAVTTQKKGTPPPSASVEALYAAASNWTCTQTVTIGDPASTLDQVGQYKAMTGTDVGTSKNLSPTPTEDCAKSSTLPTTSPAYCSPSSCARSKELTGVELEIVQKCPSTVNLECVHPQPRDLAAIDTTALGQTYTQQQSLQDILAIYSSNFTTTNAWPSCTAKERIWKDSTITVTPLFTIQQAEANTKNPVIPVDFITLIGEVNKCFAGCEAQNKFCEGKTSLNYVMVQGIKNTLAVIPSAFKIIEIVGGDRISSVAQTHYSGISIDAQLTATSPTANDYNKVFSQFLAPNVGMAKAAFCTDASEEKKDIKCNDGDHPDWKIHHLHVQW